MSNSFPTSVLPDYPNPDTPILLELLMNIGHRICLMISFALCGPAASVVALPSNSMPQKLLDPPSVQDGNFGWSIDARGGKALIGDFWRSAFLYDVNSDASCIVLPGMIQSPTICLVAPSR